MRFRSESGWGRAGGLAGNPHPPRQFAKRQGLARCARTAKHRHGWWAVRQRRSPAKTVGAKAPGEFDSRTIRSPIGRRRAMEWGLESSRRNGFDRHGGTRSGIRVRRVRTHPPRRAAAHRFRFDSGTGGSAANRRPCGVMSAWPAGTWDRHCSRAAKTVPYARVAQRIERRFPKPGAAGPTPATGTSDAGVNAATRPPEHKGMGWNDGRGWHVFFGAFLHARPAPASDNRIAGPAGRSAPLITGRSSVRFRRNARVPYFFDGSGTLKK